MRQSRRSGPPSWFIILLGIAIVFGVYYLWLGVRNFMSTGVSVAESTRQAIEQNTATAVRVQEIQFDVPTPLPSFTPVPPCQDFVVRVPIAIVRSEPSISSRIVEGLKEGETVCVITALPDNEWYLIDQNSRTRRIEKVYMHRDIIRALNPTARPTATLTPTVTLTPSQTVTPSETVVPTTAPAVATRAVTSPPPRPSPTPTPSATATSPSVSL